MKVAAAAATAAAFEWDAALCASAPPAPPLVAPSRGAAQPPGLLSASFLADGTLVAGSKCGHLYVCSAPEFAFAGALRLATFFPSAAVYSLLPSADDGEILFAGTSRGVELVKRSAHSLAAAASYRLGGDGRTVEANAVGECAELLLAAGGDGNVHACRKDAAARASSLHPAPTLRVMSGGDGGGGDSDALLALAVCDAHTFVAGSESGVVTHWDLRSAQPIRRVEPSKLLKCGASRWISSLAADADGVFVGVGDGAANVCVLHLASGTLLGSTSLSSVSHAMAYRESELVCGGGARPNTLACVQLDGVERLPRLSSSLQCVYDLCVRRKDGLLVAVGEAAAAADHPPSARVDVYLDRSRLAHSLR